MKALISFLKFSSSSAICFLIDNGLFTLMNVYICASLPNGARYFVATYSARVVSAVTNYLLNRKVVFHAQNSVVRSAERYFALSVIQAGISAGLVYLVTSFTDATGIVDTLIKIGVDTCLFIVSYQIQKRWVFQVGTQESQNKDA